MRVDQDTWTLRPTADRIEVVPGPAGAGATVSLDRAGFADLFCERRTAMGLVIAGRVEGDPASNDAFCAWDPVLRSPPRRPTGLPAILQLNLFIRLLFLIVY